MTCTRSVMAASAGACLDIADPEREGEAQRIKVMQPEGRLRADIARWRDRPQSKARLLSQHVPIIQRVSNHHVICSDVHGDQEGHLACTIPNSQPS